MSLQNVDCCSVCTYFDFCQCNWIMCLLLFLSLFFPPHSARCALEMLPSSCGYIWAMPCTDHALPIHSPSDRYVGHLQPPTNRNYECPCTCPLMNPTGHFLGQMSRSRIVGWEGVWALNMPQICQMALSMPTPVSTATSMGIPVSLLPPALPSPWLTHCLSLKI